MSELPVSRLPPQNSPDQDFIGGKTLMFGFAGTFTSVTDRSAPWPIYGSVRLFQVRVGLGSASSSSLIVRVYRIDYAGSASEIATVTLPAGYISATEDFDVALGNGEYIAVLADAGSGSPSNLSVAVRIV